VNTIEGALTVDPEYHWSYENRGKLAMRAGDPQGALGYYREALRLKPDSGATYEGLVDAIKSRNFAYRTLFGLFDWSDRQQVLWRVLVLFWVVAGLAYVLEPLGDRFERLLIAIVITAFVYTLFGYFAIFCAEPLSGFLLRSDPLGRRLLSDEDRRRSYVMAGALAATVGIVVAAAVFRKPWWALGAIPTIGSPFPLNFILRQPPGSLRLSAAIDFAGFVVVLLLLGVLICIPFIGMKWWWDCAFECHAELVRRAEVRREAAAA
jgi:hypothetical protein